MVESHRQEIAKLEALYASNPGGRVFVHLAEALRRAGEQERARSILEEGLARHPDSASGYVVLGRVLIDRGEAGAADAAFRKVLQLDRGNLVALRCLGDLAREGGRPTEAVSFYRELIARNPASEGDAALTRLLDEAQRNAAAEALAAVAAEHEAAQAAVAAEPEAPPETVAPGRAGEARAAEPEYGLIELDALPGDLASFAGLAAAEPAAAFEEPEPEPRELEDDVVVLIESSAAPLTLEELETQLAAAPAEVNLLSATPELEVSPTPELEHEIPSWTSETDQPETGLAPAAADAAGGPGDIDVDAAILNVAELATAPPYEVIPEAAELTLVDDESVRVAMPATEPARPVADIEAAQVAVEETAWPEPAAAADAAQPAAEAAVADEGAEAVIGELAGAEAVLAEEPAAAEALVAEEPAAAEALVAEEPAAAEALVAEEPAAAEALVAEEPVAAEDLFAEEPAGAVSTAAGEPAFAEPVGTEEPAWAAVAPGEPGDDARTQDAADLIAETAGVDDEYEDLPWLVEPAESAASAIGPTGAGEEPQAESATLVPDEFAVPVDLTGEFEAPAEQITGEVPPAPAAAVAPDEPAEPFAPLLMDEEAAEPFAPLLLDEEPAEPFAPLIYEEPAEALSPLLMDEEAAEPVPPLAVAQAPDLDLPAWVLEDEAVPDLERVAEEEPVTWTPEWIAEAEAAATEPAEAEPVEPDRARFVEDVEAEPELATFMEGIAAGRNEAGFVPDAEFTEFAEPPEPEPDAADVAQEFAEPQLEHIEDVEAEAELAGFTEEVATESHFVEFAEIVEPAPDLTGFFDAADEILMDMPDQPALLDEFAEPDWTVAEPESPPPADVALAGAGIGAQSYEVPVEPERAETAPSEAAPAAGASAAELGTETLGDLYLGQGFAQRAAEVYRALLEQRPGDERLAAKLSDAEMALAGTRDAEAGEDAGEVWLRGVEAAWTGGAGATGQETTPYAWTEREEREQGIGIGAYLRDLISWGTGETARAADAGTKPMPAAAAEPAERVPPSAPEPELWGPPPDTYVEPDAGAPAAPWAMSPEPVLDETWTPSTAGAPWSPPVELPADPWLAPEPTAVRGGPPEPASRGTAMDPVEEAFNEWFGPPTEPAAPASAQSAATPPPAGGEEADATAEDENDEDLEMFRAWLQSLKK